MIRLSFFSTRIPTSFFFFLFSVSPLLLLFALAVALFPTHAQQSPPDGHLWSCGTFENRAVTKTIHFWWTLGNCRTQIGPNLQGDVTGVKFYERSFGPGGTLIFDGVTFSGQPWQYNTAGNTDRQLKQLSFYNCVVNIASDPTTGYVYFFVFQYRLVAERLEFINVTFTYTQQKTTSRVYLSGALNVEVVKLRFGGQITDVVMQNNRVSFHNFNVYGGSVAVKMFLSFDGLDAHRVIFRDNTLDFVSFRGDDLTVVLGPSAGPGALSVARSLIMHNNSIYCRNCVTKKNSIFTILATHGTGDITLGGALDVRENRVDFASSTSTSDFSGQNPSQTLFLGIVAKMWYFTFKSFSVAGAAVVANNSISLHLATAAARYSGIYALVFSPREVEVSMQHAITFEDSAAFDSNSIQIDAAAAGTGGGDHIQFYASVFEPGDASSLGPELSFSNNIISMTLAQGRNSIDKTAELYILALPSLARMGSSLFFRGGNQISFTNFDASTVSSVVAVIFLVRGSASWSSSSSQQVNIEQEASSVTLDVGGTSGQYARVVGACSYFESGSQIFSPSSFSTHFTSTNNNSVTAEFAANVQVGTSTALSAHLFDGSAIPAPTSGGEAKSTVRIDAASVRVNIGHGSGADRKGFREISVVRTTRLSGSGQQIQNLAVFSLTNSEMIVAFASASNSSMTFGAFPSPFMYQLVLAKIVRAVGTLVISGNRLRLSNFVFKDEMRLIGCVFYVGGTDFGGTPFIQPEGSGTWDGVGELALHGNEIEVVGGSTSPSSRHVIVNIWLLHVSALQGGGSFSLRNNTINQSSSSSESNSISFNASFAIANISAVDSVGAASRIEISGNRIATDSTFLEVFCVRLGAAFQSSGATLLIDSNTISIETAAAAAAGAAVDVGRMMAVVLLLAPVGDLKLLRVANNSLLLTKCRLLEQLEGADLLTRLETVRVEGTGDAFSASPLISNVDQVLVQHNLLELTSCTTTTTSSSSSSNSNSISLAAVSILAHSSSSSQSIGAKQRLSLSGNSVTIRSTQLVSSSGCFIAALNVAAPIRDVGGEFSVDQNTILIARGSNIHRQGLVQLRAVSIEREIISITGKLSLSRNFIIITDGSNLTVHPHSAATQEKEAAVSVHVVNVRREINSIGGALEVRGNFLHVVTNQQDSSITGILAPFVRLRVSFWRSWTDLFGGFLVTENELLIAGLEISGESTLRSGDSEFGFEIFKRAVNPGVFAGNLLFTHNKIRISRGATLRTPSLTVRLLVLLASGTSNISVPISSFLVSGNELDVSHSRILPTSGEGSSSSGIKFSIFFFPFGRASIIIESTKSGAAFLSFIDNTVTVGGSIRAAPAQGIQIIACEFARPTDSELPSPASSQDAVELLQIQRNAINITATAAEFYAEGFLVVRIAEIVNHFRLPGVISLVQNDIRLHQSSSNSLFARIRVQIFRSAPGSGSFFSLGGLDATLNRIEVTAAAAKSSAVPPVMLVSVLLFEPGRMIAGLGAGVVVRENLINISDCSSGGLTADGVLFDGTTAAAAAAPTARLLFVKNMILVVNSTAVTADLRVSGMCFRKSGDSWNLIVEALELEQNTVLAQRLGGGRSKSAAQQQKQQQQQQSVVLVYSSPPVARLLSALNNIIASSFEAATSGTDLTTACFLEFQLSGSDSSIVAEDNIVIAGLRNENLLAGDKPLVTVQVASSSSSSSAAPSAAIDNDGERSSSSSSFLLVRRNTVVAYLFSDSQQRLVNTCPDLQARILDMGLPLPSAAAAVNVRLEQNLVSRAFSRVPLTMVNLRVPEEQEVVGNSSNAASFTMKSNRFDLLGETLPSVAALIIPPAQGMQLSPSLLASAGGCTAPFAIVRSSSSSSVEAAESMSPTASDLVRLTTRWNFSLCNHWSRATDYQFRNWWFRNVLRTSPVPPPPLSWRAPNETDLSPAVVWPHPACVSISETVTPPATESVNLSSGSKSIPATLSRERSLSSTLESTRTKSPMPVLAKTFAHMTGALTTAQVATLQITAGIANPGSVALIYKVISISSMSSCGEKPDPSEPDPSTVALPLTHNPVGLELGEGPLYLRAARGAVVGNVMIISCGFVLLLAVYSWIYQRWIWKPPQTQDEEEKHRQEEKKKKKSKQQSPQQKRKTGEEEEEAEKEKEGKESAIIPTLSYKEASSQKEMPGKVYLILQVLAPPIATIIGGVLWSPALQSAIDASAMFLIAVIGGVYLLVTPVGFALLAWHCFVEAREAEMQREEEKEEKEAAAAEKAARQRKAEIRRRRRGVITSKSNSSSNSSDSDEEEDENIRPYAVSAATSGPRTVFVITTAQKYWWRKDGWRESLPFFKRWWKWWMTKKYEFDASDVATRYGAWLGLFSFPIFGVIDALTVQLISLLSGVSERACASRACCSASLYIAMALALLHLILLIWLVFPFRAGGRTLCQSRFDSTFCTVASVATVGAGVLSVLTFEKIALPGGDSLTEVYQQFVDAIGFAGTAVNGFDILLPFATEIYESCRSSRSNKRAGGGPVDKRTKKITVVDPKSNIEYDLEVTDDDEKEEQDRNRGDSKRQQQQEKSRQQQGKKDESSRAAISAAARRPHPAHLVSSDGRNISQRFEGALQYIRRRTAHNDDDDDGDAPLLGQYQEQQQQEMQVMSSRAFQNNNNTATHKRNPSAASRSTFSSDHLRRLEQMTQVRKLPTAAAAAAAAAVGAESRQPLPQASKSITTNSNKASLSVAAVPKQQQKPDRTRAPARPVKVDSPEELNEALNVLFSPRRKSKKSTRPAVAASAAAGGAKPEAEATVAEGTEGHSVL